MKKLLSLMILMLVFACTKGTSQPQFEYKSSQGNGVVAKFGDIKITDKDLNSEIAAEIFEAESKVFDLKFNQIKAIMIDKLVEKEIGGKQMTVDEYIEKNIVNKIKISEKQIKDFIKERKIPKEHLNPQIQERIKEFLKNQEKLKAIDGWLADKTGSKAIEIFIPRPARPRFEVTVGEAPTFGSKEAKVTVVEFSDFQCPFCAKGAEILKELKSKYGNKIQVAFKNFPLDFHKQAKDAAIAGLCANEQGEEKFWKMHDKMFENQNKLSIDDLKALAKDIGLDSKKFDACLDAKKHLAQVESNIEEGKNIGVKSTPTFFVNGMMINGAQPLEVFSELIDQELK